jgi:PTH1 family peptidyl-tRNA hydrolase
MTYVLSDIPKPDRDWVNAMANAAADALPLLAMGEDEKYQAEVMRLAPAEKADPRRPA